MSGKVIASSDIIGIIPAANLPPSGGGAPQDAPYLLNGPDTSGLLTAPVNVLDLATPQPFVATAPLFGTSGAPISLEYDNGAGAAGTSCQAAFYHQSDADARFLAGFLDCTIVDPTDGAEQTELALSPVYAGAPTGGLIVRSDSAILTGAGDKTISTEDGDLTLTAAGAGSEVVVSTSGAERFRFTDTGVLSAAPGSSTAGFPQSTDGGELVEHDEIFRLSLSSPTDGGAAANIGQTSQMVASVVLDDAPSAAPGVFTIANNTGKWMTLIGVRVLLPLAGANTLDITVSNGVGVALFEGTGLAATGGTHLQCATTYTPLAAIISPVETITITAQAAPADIEAYVFIEYLAWNP